MTWTPGHIERQGKFGVCACVHKDAYNDLDFKMTNGYANRNHFTNLYRVQNHPTFAPTSPTLSPVLSTSVPSAGPSVTPSHFPSFCPVVAPSGSPSVLPTRSPSVGPSTSPSIAPSHLPSIRPSYTPTKAPSNFPTESPTWSADQNVIPKRFFTNNLYTNIVQDETSKALFLEQCTISMKDFGLECYDIQENLRQGGKAILLLEGLPNAIEEIRRAFEFSGIKIGEFPLFVPYSSLIPSISPSTTRPTLSPTTNSPANHPSPYPTLNPTFKFPSAQPSTFPSKDPTSISVQHNTNEVALDLKVAGLTEENKAEVLDAISKALLSFFEVESGVASVISHSLEGDVMGTEATLRMKFHAAAKEELAALNARIRSTPDQDIIDEASLGLLDAFVYGVQIEAVSKPFENVKENQSSSERGKNWLFMIGLISLLPLMGIFWHYRRKAELPFKDVENPTSDTGTFLEQNDTPKLREHGIME